MPRFLTDDEKRRWDGTAHYTPPEAGDEELFFRELAKHVWKNDRVNILCGKLHFTTNAQGFLRKDYRDSKMSSLKEYDIMYTPNTFIDTHDPKNETNTVKNQQQVICMGIDVDFRDMGDANGPYENMPPFQFFFMELMPRCERFIPAPSYIEYGHRLRLIYVFEQPIVCKNENGVIALAKRVQKEICKRIAYELGITVEAQGFHTYFRLPGSKNSKDGSEIKMWKVCDERWTIQEMADEFLDPLPYTKEEWEEMKRKIISNRRKKGSTDVYRGRHNERKLHQERLEAYRALQPYIKKGAREKACFLYGLSCCYVYGDQNKDLIMQKILEFNSGLSFPLKDKEIKSKLGNLVNTFRKYRFCNETICDYLNISRDLVRELGVMLDYQTEEEKRRSDAQKKRRAEEKAEKRHKQYLYDLKSVASLYRTGNFSRKEIAAYLNMKLSRVIRLITIIRKEMNGMGESLSNGIRLAVRFAMNLKKEELPTRESTGVINWYDVGKDGCAERLKELYKKPKRKKKRRQHHYWYPAAKMPAVFVG